MKRVAILIYRMGVGGAERLTIEDVRELLRRGDTVYLITFADEQAGTLMREVPAGCRIERVRIREIYDIAGIVGLARALRRIAPEMILTHLWFANTVGRIAARFNGSHKRLLAFEHNVYDRVKTRKQFFIDRLLQGWCAAIIAVAPSVKDSLVRHGIRASRIVVVPNAVDPSRFLDAPKSPIRSELHIEHAFLYLYVGRLIEQKGIDVLIDAFAQVKTGVLCIAGDGSERKMLEARAKERGIAARTFFLGIRSDIPSLMMAADCFVLPSRWEGNPMVLLEAIAAGAPIVVADFPAALDVLRDGETARIVPREDSSALAHAMDQIQTDQALRDTLRKNLMSERTRFAPQEHVDRVLACIK